MYFIDASSREERHLARVKHNWFVVSNNAVRQHCRVGDEK